MSDDKIKAALVNVMDGLLIAYDDERKQDKAWQDLFKKVDGCNFESLLREAACKMETIALDTFDMIETELAKEGKKPLREVFNLIYALPYVENILTREAKSSVCSVDKAFYIMNKFINK